MSVDMLDLREIADEWQERLDEREELLAADNTQDDEAAAEIVEECAKYAELCEQLGVSPVEPATLKWWAENNEPTLINEGDFAEYAEELASDLGLIPEDNAWPAYCIDWERAADELRTDYTSIEYDGTDYYMRSC